MRGSWCALLGIVWVLLSPASSSAVVIYQIDTFEDGLKANWTNGAGGGGGSIDNIPDGGPAGLGDNFLRLSSGAFGGATRLISFNDIQWSGDYTAAGVLQIAMDLKNFGTSPVPMRVAIREANSSSSTPGYSSTIAFVLPADGEWYHAVFMLDEASMTPINSPAPFATDIANVIDFRILSSVAPATIGDAITARVGIDNILAVPGIPEPSILGATALALLALATSRRRG